METAALARASREHRDYLVAVAYRMLGEYADAEDIAQEALLRYAGALATGEDVRSARALLTTITTRLAIDHLRSARVRRERYVGEWLPEPLVEEYLDPGEVVASLDSVSTAMLVLLDRLTPEQRAVFVLHEVFGYAYPEIAQTIDSSAQACRQLGVRARRAIEAGQSQHAVSRAAGDELARAFIAACLEGDLSGLLELLAPRARFVGDGGASGRGFRLPIEGAETVARVLLGVVRRVVAEGFEVALVHVGGQPGLCLLDASGGLFGVWSLVIDDGVVRTIYGAVNPDKLGHLGVQVSQIRIR